MSLAPAHSGYLQVKVDGASPSYITCYCAVEGTTLRMWETKPANEGVPPNVLFPLGPATVADYGAEPHSWTVKLASNGGVYTFIASSDSERQTWMALMQDSPGGSESLLQTSDAGSMGEQEGTLVFSSEKDSGAKISDFKKVGLLGQGFFGNVYLVEKSDTGERFAMKEMKKSAVESQHVIGHITAEGAILQKMNHPFIVRLHYAFHAEDRVYLVLDLLAGGELFFHLSKVLVFDEYRAKFYAAEIALALGYLHSLGIIYRDLKPENVVLDAAGNACLTDFGLAKANVLGNTTNTFCGTPEYLAPEFLLDNPHGRAVDWWSLGILLYEMLQGIPPFYDKNTNAMFEKILVQELAFSDKIQISDEAKDLLRRLLDRDATTRLQSIDEIRKHPFFSDIDLDLLYQKRLPTPFKPDPNAVNNFAKEFTQQVGAEVNPPPCPQAAVPSSPELPEGTTSPLSIVPTGNSSLNPSLSSPASSLKGKGEDATEERRAQVEAGCSPPAANAIGGDAPRPLASRRSSKAAQNRRNSSNITAEARPASTNAAKKPPGSRGSSFLKAAPSTSPTTGSADKAKSATPQQRRSSGGASKPKV